MIMRTGLISGIAVLAILSGCSDVNDKADSALADASDRIAAASQQFYGAETQRASGVQIQQRAFVAPEREKTAPAMRLPASQARRDVSIVSRSPLTLTEIVARLNEITGVPFSVKLGSNGAVTVATPQLPTAAAPAEGAAATDATAAPAPSVTPVSAVIGGDASPTATQKIRPNLSGSLGTVLDQIAAAFEVEWSYEDGRVVFRDFVTRRYQVTLLPTKVGFWEEVRQAVDGMVSSGSRISYGTSTGIVTVSARLGDHETIQRYIAELNEQLGQQIAFDINVLSVNLDEGSDLSVSITGALTEQNLNTNLTNTTATIDQTGAFNIGLTSDTVDVDAMVKSLARSGRVAIETRAGAITTNFQPVPISVTDTVTYVASASSNYDDDGNLVSTELTTETLEVGFVLLVLPRILNSREVLLNYSIELSDINDFEQIGDLQLPSTSKKVLDQQAIMRNGQSLVIAGFERRQTEVKNAKGLGQGDNKFFGLGGSRSSELNRQSTVIVITPRLLARTGSR